MTLTPDEIRTRVKWIVAHIARAEAQMTALVPEAEKLEDKFLWRELRLDVNTLQSMRRHIEVAAKESL